MLVIILVTTQTCADYFQSQQATMVSLLTVLLQHLSASFWVANWLLERFQAPPHYSVVYLFLLSKANLKMIESRHVMNLLQKQAQSAGRFRDPVTDEAEVLEQKALSTFKSSLPPLTTRLEVSGTKAETC